MKRKIAKWTVKEIIERWAEIDFPEYQREPYVWSGIKRRRLIDSMLRDFDISTIYFYQNANAKQEGKLLECVDGRQRLQTLMTLYGRNTSDSENHEDTNIDYFSENEVSQEDSSKIHEPFSTNASKESDSYKSLTNVRERLSGFPINIVLISDIKDPSEMALLFQRLNLGTPLNAGEKLNAMIGDARDTVFEVFASHRYFKDLNIPARRFAKELVAAQIMMQVFGIVETKAFTRTRHSDLQKYFKDHQKFTPEHKIIVSKLISKLDTLSDNAKKHGLTIDNRAIAVTYAVYEWMSVINEKQKENLAIVLETMRKTIRWQSHDAEPIWDQAYRKLADFQLNVTQAAVESYSVRNRHNLLEEFLEEYAKSRRLLGDTDYITRTKKDPTDERKTY